MTQHDTSIPLSQHNKSLESLPKPLQHRLTRELDPGETVLWAGQPCLKRLRINRRSPILFGRIMTLVAIALSAAVGTYLHLTDQFDGIPKEDYLGVFVIIWICGIFALLMLALLLYDICTPDSVLAQSKRVIYAVTNHRAIILRIQKKGNLTERDYTGGELIHLARKEYHDGTGNLTLESAGGTRTTLGLFAGHEFHAIENVIEVERLLRGRFGSGTSPAGHPPAGHPPAGHPPTGHPPVSPQTDTTEAAQS